MDTLEDERPAHYLTRLATSEVGRAYKSLVLDEMRVRGGSTVLDLGCGPGADLPALAAAVGPGGRVIGIDRDATAVAEAATSTSARQVAVAVGDAHRLPLPAATVDRVHTDRVLQHVDDPEAVIAETARVLRPGGVVACAEPDWDTLVVDLPDPEVSASYRRFVVDRVVRNARSGRQVPAWCEGAGLVVAKVLPVTAVYRDAVEADRVLGFRRVTARAVEAAYLSPAQRTALLEHVGRAPVFVSVTLFVTLATRA